MSGTVYQLVDRSKNRNVFFLNTIASGSPYGATLAKHVLSILDSNNNPAFPGSGAVNFQGLNMPLGYVLNTVETLGVVKPTEPTLAAGGEYGFTLTQYNPYTNAYVNHTINASVPLVGGVTTPGTIATAWAAQIASFKDFNVTTSVSGAVLTITAAAGYPILTVPAVTGGVTLGSGTTGVAGVGNTYDMQAMNGITTAPFSTYAGYVAANAYDLAVFDWQSTSGAQGETVFFVNTGDANYTNFKTQLVTNILKVGSASFAEAALAVD